MNKHILLGILFSIISVFAFGQVGSVGDSQYNKRVSYFCEAGVTFYVIDISLVYQTSPIKSDTFDISNQPYSPVSPFTAGICPELASVCIDTFTLDGENIKIQQENCPPALLSLSELIDSLVLTIVDTSLMVMVDTLFSETIIDSLCNELEECLEMPSMELDTFVNAGVVDCSIPGSEVLILSYNSDSGLPDFNIPVDCLMQDELDICDTAPTINQVLSWDGNEWCPADASTSNDNWGFGFWTVSADSGPNFTVNEFANVDVTGTNGITTSLTGSQLTIDGSGIIDICDAAPTTDQVLTWDGTEWCPADSSSGADDWGNGFWQLRGDTGPTAIVSQSSSVVDVNGLNGISTYISGGDLIIDGDDIIDICDTAPTSDQVLTWDGNEWCPADASTSNDNWGFGFWTVSADSGPNFTVNEFTNVDVTGTNGITTSLAGSQLTIDGSGIIDICDTAPTSDQVLTWDGTEWCPADSSSGADDWGNGFWTIGATNGPDINVNQNDQIDFIGTSGITTTMTGDILYIDGSGITGSDDWGNGTWTVSDGVNDLEVTENYDLDVLGTGGITTMLTGGNLVIDGSGITGSDDWGNGSFDLSADTGTTASVSQDTEVTIAGGTSISTSISGETVTVNLDGKSVDNLTCGALSGHLQINYQDGTNDNVNLASCIQPCSQTTAGKLCYEDCEGSKFVMIK